MGSPPHAVADEDHTVPGSRKLGSFNFPWRLLCQALGSWEVSISQLPKGLRIL